MNVVGPSFGMFEILPVLMLLVYIVVACLGIYALVLFIKLARRGIEALDIYLYEKRGR
ncbi:hypothetical protein NYE69_16525 [Paenibacillus sp. FSL R5-0527]|uniref:hypothetical protein n=1 Tax=Paenibacillus TaxID=44249 RepID=UPI0026C46F12|nr:hypothetical protein [Paenibacillus macerans]